VVRAKELSEGDGRTNGEDLYEIPVDLRRAKVTQVKRLLDNQYVEHELFDHESLLEILILYPQVYSCRGGTVSSRTAEYVCCIVSPVVCTA